MTAYDKAEAERLIAVLRHVNNGEGGASYLNSDGWHHARFSGIADQLEAAGREVERLTALGQPWLPAEVAELTESLLTSETRTALLEVERESLLAILRAIWPVWLALQCYEVTPIGNVGRRVTDAPNVWSVVDALEAARAALTPELLAAARAAGLEVP